MILHLLDDEKFTSHIVALFEKAFPGQNRYLLGVKSANSLKYEIKSQAVEVQKIGSNEYYSYIKQHPVKVTIIHGLNSYKKKLINSNVLVGKTALVLWGAELYNRIWDIRKQNYLPKTKIIRISSLLVSDKALNLLDENVLQPLIHYLGFKNTQLLAFSKMDAIFTNIKGDYELLLKYIKTKPTHLWFTYYGLDEIAANDTIKNAGKNLLLGNSATFTNNHLEAFDTISKVKLPGKVILPLSYGDHKYAAKIARNAQDLFGDKIHALTEFMSLEDYNKLLDSCGFVMFNHTRQQGVGNLTYALYTGKKVFLRQSNTAYKYFKGLGIVLYTVEEMEEDSLSTPLTPDEVNNNKLIIEKEFNSEKLIKKLQSNIKTLLA